ncbi:MAG: HAMP domain-containing sensor histidine kinase [Clostridiales bacterium]|nr:HAMP domain-containing sensor histidine kinase [Clostridiales bacterium]
MYDFGEGLVLGGLLEQLKSAAVAVSEGAVCDYNSAAVKILPELREGERLCEPEPGVIELCGVALEAVSFELEGYTVYTFAAPARTAVETALPLLENLSMAIRESLSSSFVASEFIANTAERERAMGLERYNAILRHEQYKLLRLAENLQELCALSRADNVLSPSLFELDELCSNVMDTVGAMMKERGLKLRFSAEGAGFVIYADMRRVERMLLEVLADSAELCSSGCTVSMSLKRDGSRYYIIIEDDGRGIKSEEYSDVFESFARPMRPEGELNDISLSLSVARNVALCHGGGFVLDSEPGRGTKVVISLPAGCPRRTEMNSSRVEYAANPLRPVLTAFSGILDYKYFAPPYL